MPLHPPTGSALTAPVYFGLRLNSSRVRTPGLLRAHLQTVRQTLQCDFIVIPTASANSLAASKKDAAQKAKNAVQSSADVARDIRATDSTAAGIDCHSTDTATPLAGPGSRISGERSPLTDKEACCEVAVRSPAADSFSAGKREDICASSLIACPAATTTSAQSVVLVESPPFATARATIPAQHLADAATDFSAFCSSLTELPRKSGSCALRDGSTSLDREAAVGYPAHARMKPSFRALDGGLATLPATYSFEPSTESDLPLDSQTWNAAVVCELSSWISPDVGVLPRRRKLATVSPVTQSSHPASNTTSASRSVSATSSSRLAPSSALEGCPAADFSVPASHTRANLYSPVAAASPESSYAVACAKAAGEDTDVCASKRPPVATPNPEGAPSKEPVEGQEKQTHYNKRSRTAAGGGELKLLERKGTAREQMEEVREIEQGHNCTHDQQQQETEAPCSVGVSAGTVAEEVHKAGGRSDCSASPQAEPPAATLDSFDSRASSPLSAASVLPAVGGSGAPTADASAEPRDREWASQRGRKIAARQKKQRYLKHGLLRHWSFHEAAWQREMQWATHVGAFAVITPPPIPDLIPVEYSRLLRAALNQLQPPIIWVKLPLVYNVGSQSSESFLSCWSSSSSSGQSSSSSSQSSDSEDVHREDVNARYSSSEHSMDCRSSSNKFCRRHHRGSRDSRQLTKRQTDPWRIWQYIRSMVGPHPSLGVCLELTPDLPDSDSELERWFAEPLRAVVLSPPLFTTSSRCDSNSGTLYSSVRSTNSAGTSQAPRGKGRVGNNVFSATGETTTRASAGGSGVCLSPRHHLFLMKCAQHRVKLIFQPDEDEEGEETFEAEQPGDLLSLGQGAQQQQPVGQLTAEHFPSLSAAAGCATGKQRGSHSLTASAGLKRNNMKTAFCLGGVSSSHKEKECKKHAPPVEEMQPYISYVAQQLLQLPPLKQTELFSAPYRDVLQSPMQPLADNLSAGNYEVFEKDPVKYLRYKEATLLRLREIWPGTSTQQQQRQHQCVDREEQPYQVQAVKKQQRQEGGKLVETQQREGHAAVAAGSSTGIAFSERLEAQKQRKKNRRRKHEQSACNRASSRDCESEDDGEEEDEKAANFPDASSSGDACSFSSASARVFSFPSSSPSPPFPPAPPCLPCASPSLSSSSNIFSANASDWCLRGADCTVHAAAGRRLVLTVVGAGRGPLVQAALEALREAGVPLCRTRVFAVEKNWNAVITLRSRVRSDTCLGWRAVEVVEADMREAGDCVAERADILISELLGSFGDNELSAECLDGAQMRLLKKGGISIPSAYISSLEPVATHTLWQAIDSYKDPKQFECTYVVNMFAKYFPAKEGPRECFHYRHPHFLLPFGDEGDSCIGERGGSSSSSTTDDSEDSSDSGSYNENKSSREAGSPSRRQGSCRRDNVGVRSDQSTAERQEDRRDAERTKEIVSNTSKRHDKNAEPVEIFHAQEATRRPAQGSERSAASWDSKLRDTRVCAASAANTATNACAKSEEIGPAEETGGNTAVRKWQVSREDFPCVRERRNRKKDSSRQQRAFTAAELTALRHRRTRLSWRMQTDAVVHGLAGYFHCCLYKNVYISIDPRSFSEGMFSWFPLFIPFREPVYVHRNKKLEVYIARDGDEHKVWYEWAVLQPTPSEIYNHMGKYSYIGK